MSRSKAKGTAAEGALAQALQRLGWLYAERRALSGVFDKGDIVGCPGLMWEQKDAVTWKLPEWMREVESQRLNSRADFGILSIKAPGVGYPNAERWVTIMEMGSAHILKNMSNSPRIRTVTLGAVGAKKVLEELKERERHCGGTPVEVIFKGRRTTSSSPVPMYSMMRLDARCKLLVDAGYGGHAIMVTASSGTMKEYPDD